MARAAGLQGAPPTNICLDVARIGILSDALGRLWGVFLGSRRFPLHGPFDLPSTRSLMICRAAAMSFELLSSVKSQRPSR
jgi:hypothetical protein